MRPLALLCAILLAGCSSLGPTAAPAPSWGTADFTSYVALGTSISMGIQSGGLLDANQANSAPARIARQAGANGGAFVQPLVAAPGIPNLLHVVSLVPLVIAPLPGTTPAGPYVARPADGYDNLSISGALLSEVITREFGGYFDLVLQGHGTALRQAIAQNPTFVTVELGSNEAIGPLLAGTANYATMVSEGQFAAEYAQLLDSLQQQAPQAKLALANVPDVTLVPYATTVPLDETVPLGPGGTNVTLRLRDSVGPLEDGSLILLPAVPFLQAGYGLPSPAPPLPDSLVITVAERIAIRTAIDGYNAVIAQQAAARGAALVDEHALFDRLAAQGATVSGVHYTFRYVTGGLFSLDGIHPSSLGSGILANAFLEAIDAKFGARIPPVALTAAGQPL